MGALAVAVFCGLLFLFMRMIGALMGSRTAGTVAGIGLVTLPLVILAVAAVVALLFVFGGAALLLAIPVLVYIGYRRLRSG